MLFDIHHMQIVSLQCRCKGELMLNIHCTQMISHHYHTFHWTRRWWFKLDPLANDFLHTSHAYGFLSLWIRQWSFKIVLLEYAFWQTSHTNLCSPVWMWRWSWKCCFCRNAFWHTMHTNALVSQWTKRWWFFRVPICKWLLL